MNVSRPSDGRVVIFGGAGFIGTHLTARFSAQGRDVLIADVRTPAQIPAGASFTACDVRQPISLPLPPSASPPWVINLAAVHRTPGHPEHEYYETNVSGAHHVTAWSSAHDVTRLTFTSSISVYGPSEEWKDESTETNPASAYGRSKLIAEGIHQAWADAGADRKLTILRPAVIFGSGERGNFTRLAAAMRARRFVLPGRRDTVKSCGYVGDLVDAVLFAEDVGGLYNFCYPTPTSIDQICAAFVDVAGFRSPWLIPPGVMNLPLAFAARVPAGVGARSLAERVRKLQISTAIRPAALQDAGFEWASDVRSALAEWAKESGGRFV